jgi:hypothetical protein
VPAVAKSDERRVALSLVELTNVVTRLLPFHNTEEPETKPVPFNVRVRPVPPVTEAVGARGSCRDGIGFGAVPDKLMVCGLPEVLSITLIDADRVPRAVG